MHYLCQFVKVYLELIYRALLRFLWYKKLANYLCFMVVLYLYFKGVAKTFLSAGCAHFSQFVVIR